MFKNYITYYMMLGCFLTSYSSTSKKAIIIGATGGMAQEVAKMLSKEGYSLGLAGRKFEVLESLQKDLVNSSYIKKIDVTNTQESLQVFNELIDLLGGLDLLIIAVTGFYEKNATEAVLTTDLFGFYRLAKAGLDFFEQQKHGHLVGFTSIDGIRGTGKCAEYSAAKSFCSRYMESKRNYFIQQKLPIYVTDIIPGWINHRKDPNFAKTHPEAYWFESVEDAAQEIFDAINNRVSVAYITQRWKQVADMIKVMPDELYNALGGL